MREVTHHAFFVLRTIAERQGERIERICEGVISPAEAAKEGMSWDVFCALTEKMETLCGGPARFQSEGACTMQMPELGPALSIMRTVAGTTGLYWANFRWGGPNLFRIVTTSFEVLPDGRYSGTIVIPPTHRACDAFHHLCAGVFQALPRGLGLPDADVAISVDGRVGTYLITPPPSMTIWARIHWAWRGIFSSRELVSELATRNEELTRESREAVRARNEAIDALRIRSEFMNTMSHELRTPLNGILGMTQLMLGTDLDADQRDSAQTIQSSGHVLLRLINDILDFAKMDAGQLVLDPAPADVRALVEEVLQGAAPHASARSLDVLGVVDAAVPAQVSIDGMRLRQVLTNLVDNAVKFTTAGQVTVRVGVECRTPFRLGVSVSDTGMGISVEQRSRIFQPFMQADNSTTRNFGGTGLGLSICSGIVSAMGGLIQLESEVGKGSTFAFSIDAVSTRPLLLPSSRRNVEVVAGDGVREALAVILSEEGWGVVESGGEAVFVDSDAHSVSLRPGVPVIAMSRAPRKGSGSLHKPLRREEVRAALTRVSELAGGTGRRRVAVLDDDPVQRRILTRALARLGHDLAGEERPDVVVLTVHEGNVKDNPVASARQRWAEVRVVAVGSGDVATGGDATPDAVVTRPIDVEALGRALAG